MEMFLLDWPYVRATPHLHFRLRAVDKIDIYKIHT